jgi:hypothetical protein
VDGEQPELKAEDIAEIDDTAVSDIHTRTFPEELEEDQPIESQFGSIGTRLIVMSPSVWAGLFQSSRWTNHPISTS